MPDLSIFDNISVDNISKNLSPEDIAHLDQYQKHFEDAINLLLQNRARVRTILAHNFGPALEGLAEDNIFRHTVTPFDLEDEIESDASIEFTVNRLCNDYEKEIYETISKETKIERQPYSLALARLYGVPETSCKPYTKMVSYGYSSSSYSRNMHEEFGGYRQNVKDTVPEKVSFPSWRDVAELVFKANGDCCVKDIELQKFIDDWRCKDNTRAYFHFRIERKNTTTVRISDLLSYSTGGYGHQSERTLGTYRLKDFLRFVSIFEGTEGVDFTDPFDGDNVRWNEPYRLSGAPDIEAVSFTKNAMMDIVFKEDTRADAFFKFCTTTEAGDFIPSRLAENKPKKQKYPYFFHC